MDEVGYVQRLRNELADSRNVLEHRAFSLLRALDLIDRADRASHPGRESHPALVCEAFGSDDRTGWTNAHKPAFRAGCAFGLEPSIY